MTKKKETTPPVIITVSGEQGAFKTPIARLIESTLNGYRPPHAKSALKVVYADGNNPTSLVKKGWSVIIVEDINLKARISK